MGYLDSCRTRSAVSTCDSCKKSAPPQPRKLRVFKLKELARATNSFSRTNVLGKGSHACVYKAVLDDGQVVAVKRPTIGRRTLQDVTSFANELEVLSTLQHRHLVNLIGYCNESSEKLLVVEFMGNGTLFDLLHSSTEPLSWSLRVHMAFQAAKAILALHSASPPIIHRDVKSSNILVDSNWNAKLGDLGLALRGHLEDVVRQRAPPAGTMGYIDPQYETPSQLSSKSDVFSFGILLLEIMSGRNAIDVRFNPSSIVDWAVPLIGEGKSLALCDPALKPPQNTRAVKQLAAIAARSVRLSRDRRPTMAEVVEGLGQIRKKLPLIRIGGQYVRNTLSSTAGTKGEVLEDFSDGASSCKSETLSIFDEGSVVGEGNTSSASSSHSNHSHMSIRRRSRVGDCSFDGDVVAATRLGSPTAAGLGTSKFEQPLFDPNFSFRMSSCMMKTDMVCSFPGSPVPLASSPRRAMSNDLIDRSNSMRSLESPTFGSKGSLRIMDRRTSVTAPRLSTDHASLDDKNLPVPYLSPQLENFNLRTLREPGRREASLASSSHLPGDNRKEASLTSSSHLPDDDRREASLASSSHLPDDNRREASLASSNHLPDNNSSWLLTNEVNENLYCETELSAPSELINETGVITHAYRTLDSTDGDAKASANGSPGLQPTMSFTKDFLPIWSTTATTRTFCAESHFEKVDLPIAV